MLENVRSKSTECESLTEIVRKSLGLVPIVTNVFKRNSTTLEGGEGGGHVFRNDMRATRATPHVAIDMMNAMIRLMVTIQNVYQ